MGVLYIVSGSLASLSLVVLMLTRNHLRKNQIYQEILTLIPSKTIHIIVSSIILMISYFCGSLIVGKWTYTLLVQCLLSTPFILFLIQSICISRKMVDITPSMTDLKRVLYYSVLMRRTSLVGIVFLAVFSWTHNNI